MIYALHALFCSSSISLHSDNHYTGQHLDSSCRADGRSCSSWDRGLHYLPLSPRNGSDCIQAAEAADAGAVAVAVAVTAALA